MTMIVNDPSVGALEPTSSGFGEWVSMQPEEQAITALGRLALAAADQSGRIGQLTSLARPNLQRLQTAGIDEPALCGFLASLAN